MVRRIGLAITAMLLAFGANAEQVAELTSNGSTTDWYTLSIGEASIALSGDFDGGTVKLQRRLSDESAMDVSDASWTDDFAGPIYLGGSYIQIRFYMDGGTSPDVRVEINERYGK